MTKKGAVEMYLFLAFAAIATLGLTYTLLSGQPTGKWGEGMDCQSQCFGTEPGVPLIGQESYGGSQLRQCLSNCQSGIPPNVARVQECYTCNAGGVLQKLTAEDQTEAQIMCERMGGTSAYITNAVARPCNY